MVASVAVAAPKLGVLGDADSQLGAVPNPLRAAGGVGKLASQAPELEVWQ